MTILLCDGDQPAAAGWNVTESVRSRFGDQALVATAAVVIVCGGPRAVASSYRVGW